MAGLFKDWIFRYYVDSSVPQNIIQKLNYVESDVNLIALPLSHSFGLGCLHVSLFLGSTVILVENTSDIELLLDLTTKNNATTIAAVPITLNKIIQKKNLNLEEKLILHKS